MRTYKKIMNAVTAVEHFVLAVSLLLVLFLTFGNVIMRKVFQHSLGFTEELTVAVFVLISMLAAGVAARSGELVSLTILPDALDRHGKKVLNLIRTACCVAYSALLTVEGFGRMAADSTYTPILHIAKSVFWGFIAIGGISLMLHFIENCIDFQAQPEAGTNPCPGSEPMNPAETVPQDTMKKTAEKSEKDFTAEKEDKS